MGGGVSDRIKSIVVVLENDYREDDAAEIIMAIRMIKGVIDAQPTAWTSDDWVIRSRIRREMTDAIFAAINKP